MIFEEYNKSVIRIKIMNRGSRKEEDFQTVENVIGYYEKKLKVPRRITGCCGNLK